MHAVATGGVEVLLALVELGTEINSVSTKPSGGQASMHIAISHHDCDLTSQKLLVALLAAGADLNLRDALGRTALNAAAAAGRLTLVQLLLSAGADANILDAQGKSPWYWAHFNNHADCAALLPVIRYDWLARHQATLAATYVYEPPVKKAKKKSKPGKKKASKS